MPPASLTPAQQAIVDHEQGPAVVLGVAGAGKTTALEYRIGRLVRTSLFEANRILVAACDAAAAADMRRRLARHPGCREVAVVTLHALGLSAVQAAYDQGRLHHLNPNWRKRLNGASRAVLAATLTEARSRQATYAGELDALDAADFLAWMSALKGNLYYPDEESIPPDLVHSELVSLAVPPDDLPWYADLYRLYEEVRLDMGLLTADDQLLTGWEMLSLHGSVLRPLQARFDCVIVDDFQDVNLAQAEILDMVAHPHLNYMVTGSDDQTLYAWRGARPDVLLDFAQRYGARQYPLTECLRCRAGPLLLANAVIEHNRRRTPKTLHLTRGFGGHTEILGFRTPREMGAAIVDDIQQLRAGAMSYSDMAVLVRGFAQTPPVEQAFIAADIPYVVAGAEPFYKRPEVQTLVDYCRLAYLDSQMAAGEFLSPAQTDQFRRSWERIYAQPRRDISPEAAASLAETALVQQAPMGRVLIAASASEEPARQEEMQALGVVLRWLAGAFRNGPLSNRSAHDVLRELDERLGYAVYLATRHGLTATGSDQAETVRHFLDFAAGRGSLRSFLAGMQRLDQTRAQARQQADRQAVVIRTIETARGLEWPVVFIPSCEPDVLPHHLAGDIEEERRLLYTALTRSRQHLFVYYLRPTPSPFLTEANFVDILHDVTAMRTAAAKLPIAWTSEDVAAIAATAVRRGVWTYFRDWVSWPEDVRRHAARRVIAYYKAADQAGSYRDLGIPPDALQFWIEAATSPAPEPRKPGRSFNRWLRKLGR